ncbi:unnamed protein product, partial [Medioppia subpectinata]
TGGRICCFSPCVEQVQKTCAALYDNHFFDIETYECVLRPYEVKTQSMPLYPFSSKTNYSQQNAVISESIDKKSDESVAKKVKTESILNDKSDTVMEKISTDHVLTYLPNQGTGHTGFLTVAVKYD